MFLFSTKSVAERKLKTEFLKHKTFNLKVKQIYLFICLLTFAVHQKPFKATTLLPFLRMYYYFVHEFPFISNENTKKTDRFSR